MATILDDDFTIKIISVDRSSISSELVTLLESYKVWEDQFLQEDIYDPYEISEVRVKRFPDLAEIVTTCEKRNAQYFRLINP